MKFSPPSMQDISQYQHQVKTYQERVAILSAGFTSCYFISQINMLFQGGRHEKVAWLLVVSLSIALYDSRGKALNSMAIQVL
jgi:hypothetical protein